MQIKRRQILLAGMTAGIAATVGSDFVSRQAKRNRNKALLALATAGTGDQTKLLKQVFAADAERIHAGTALQKMAPATRPPISYDRAISKLLIQCSKLATQQYLTGKIVPTYDGSIKTLPGYFNELDSYTQLASFKGEDTEIEDTIEVAVPTTAQRDSRDALEEQASQVQDTVGQTVKAAIQLNQWSPVYLGFVLTSKTRNIIVFRGTQRNIEWLYNLYARQQDFEDSKSGQFFGRVHQGFVANYRSIIQPIPVEVAAQLDPSIPCYITGHSLGASLAILASMELAYRLPALKPQIRLYSYAGSRVGDLTFATTHTEYVPNHYRIVNAADIVPLLPPLQSPTGQYFHTGEEWSFLCQKGDFLPNHVVDLYREAVTRKVETNKRPSHPVSGDK
jgi:predicted lipase